MKTQVVTMAGLLIASGVLAQTQKGNGILSGSVSAGYSQQKQLIVSGPTSLNSTWKPALSLTAGRFWTDNWLAGVSLSGTSTITRQSLGTALSLATTPATSVAITATPFVRRYWQVNSVYLFAGVGLAVNVNDNKQSFYDSNGQLVEYGQKTSSIGLNPQLEAGVNYFLTNRLSLQLVASASSLPLNTAGLSAGLVYWTGPGRNNDPQEEQTNSQTDPGRWVLEGGFSMSNQKNNQAENTGGIGYQSTSKLYSFSPSVGFFIKKNNLIGVSIPIYYSAATFVPSDPNLNSASNDTWTIGISPYFQHYWTSTRLTPYTRVNVGYTHYSLGPFSNYTINGGVSLGLAYMAGQRFIIETSLVNASAGYSPSSGLDTVRDTKTWGGNISAGLTSNFAVRYVLH